MADNKIVLMGNGFALPHWRNRLDAVGVKYWMTDFERRDNALPDEVDVAIDELRWLLAGCSGMIDAHFLLGKLGRVANAA